MKALVWHGKEDVRVDVVPDPSIREPTDAIVRVTATAICGSDLHLYSKLGIAIKEGDILGHEAVGVVEETGGEVQDLSGGDRVVVPFNISCGRCFMCERGLQSQCETTQNRAFDKGGSLFGYTQIYGGVPGAQAELLRVPMAHYGPVKAAAGVEDERLVLLADVLPTAWQAVAYADVPPDGTVGVWGLGPIGQMCARIAFHRGAARVLGIDRVPERLAMAVRHGVETIDFEAVDDVPELVRELTEGRGVDAAIDAVGMEAAGSAIDAALHSVRVQPDRLHGLRECGRSVRRGGTISIVGVYVGPMPFFPLGDFMDKQITVRMGQANVRRWTDEILPLLDGGDPLGTTDLVTHVLPLERAAEAYELFQQKRNGAIKIVLRPGGAA
jgi:threonine dehydrogenase-like Zn-dependent dehydrogenase